MRRIRAKIYKCLQKLTTFYILDSGSKVPSPLLGCWLRSPGLSVCISFFFTCLRKGVQGSCSPAGQALILLLFLQLRLRGWRTEGLAHAPSASQPQPSDSDRSSVPWSIRTFTQDVMFPASLRCVGLDSPECHVSPRTQPRA